MSTIKNLNIFQKLSFILVLVFVISSCRTQKIAAVEVPKIPKEERVDSVFTRMKINELKFNYLQAKFSADYENEGNIKSFSGQIRMCKDSAIWISISPGLGIELFRIIVSQDSIKLLDKINRTFLSTEIEYINKLLSTDLDYDMLQALLLGSDFPYYETNVFETGLAGKEFKLSTIGRHKLKKIIKNNEEYTKVLVQNMWIDKDSYKITKQSVKQVINPNKKVEVDYSNFLFLGNQIFPHLLQIRLEDKVVIKLKIEYTKIVLDEEITFPMKVPENYTIKSISNQ